MYVKLEPQGRSLGKVILFFPRFEFGQYPVWMPLEIMTLGTSLRQAGFTAVLVDERLRADGPAIVGREAAEALFVGFSARPGDQVKRSMKLMRDLKGAHPDLPIVFGGWFPSTFPDACLEIPEVDHVVQGAADTSIVELAHALRRGEPDAEIDGVHLRLGGRHVRRRRRALEDIEATPCIDWGAFPVADYVTPDGCINLYTSRGCPGMCRFCGVPSVFPRLWSGYSAGRVVDDIEALHRAGARIFKVLDTDFFPDHERAREICRGIIARGLDITWIADVRVRDAIRFDDEMWDLLVRSGCRELETGGEAGADGQLEAMAKECSSDEILEVARTIVGHGIAVRTNFILGLPSEGRAELRETLGLVERIQALGPLAKMQFYRFTPSPATRFGAETWHKRRRGHDGTIPRDLESINGIPINFEEAEMFWLDPEDERRVKRLYYFYLPLVYYFQANGRRGVRRWGLKQLIKLARLRVRHGITAFPFERALCRLFKRPMPRTREFEWAQPL